MTIREANHLYTVSYLAFQGNLLQTINQSSLWRPKVDIFTNARRELRDIFEYNPSLRVKAQDSETLRWAWKAAVRALVEWFENPKNKTLVLTYFKGKLPTEKDFPQECPYTFEQVMQYKPWVEENP
ncbi:DUF29 family protein [Thermocrinis sp.]|jgi:hypothetical protein|uniref:DUF29 family protein n=1 Tax=Thermocrinis sp. TaxID=2024383 RepID=UPI003BFBBEF0